MNLFKGLIKCKNCNSNFIGKLEGKTYNYICSGYKNKGGSSYCPRNVIHESDIVALVNLHCQDSSISSHKNAILIELIDKIEIDGEMVTIYYSDGTTTIWNSHKLEV